MQTWTESGELDIGYKGKMFAQPVVEYTLEHAIPNGGSPEEDRMIRAAYEKQWDAMMTFVKKKRAATIKRTMDKTEKDIAKRPPADKEKSIAKANAQIEMGLDLFRKVEVKRLAEGCMAKVYNDLEKALAKKVPRQVVKTELKIDQPVLIKLAVEEDTTAEPEQKEDVLDAKLIASIIAGVSSITTMIGAIVPSAKTIRTEYTSYSGLIEKIKEDVAELEKAVASQKKKGGAEERKRGLEGVAKLLIRVYRPIIEELDSHISKAQDKVTLLRNEFGRTLRTLDDTAAALKKLSSIKSGRIADTANEALGEAKKAHAALEMLDENSEAFDALKAEAKLLTRLEGDFDGRKIRKLAGDAEGKREIVFFAMAVGNLAAAVGMLSKAADKLSKESK
jgi:hypothetical protein